jgi:transcriptional regulator with GAF, ATPase, and Fis domain
MATLRYFPAQHEPRSYLIAKPVTTLGAELGNDVALSDPGVCTHHAQILFDGRDFQLEEVDRQGEILINGKKKRRSRLVHGDRIQLGSAQLGFSALSEVPFETETPDSSRGPADMAGLRRLQVFSERLMTRGSVDDILETLLDDVVELTRAARGIVLLVDPTNGEQEAPRVRASRSYRGESLQAPSVSISDSIVRQVLASKRPVIVSDALSDTTFGKSESVIALRLSSVMCVPLLNQGEVIGAIYVGNDEIKSLFNKKQLDLLTVYAAQASLILQNALLVSTLRADKEKLSAELHDKRFGEIIGSCSSMLEVFRKLQKVAGTDISVLITGETGTGKELIARELHRRSHRVKGPFVTVNCGAIPETLIESELFGHVRGAFTGAIATRAGKFQQADGGTLFLDEIGELSPQLQVKLLRALQEKIVCRVGDSRPEKCDIRIVAATNRSLEDMIKTGEFREDLYYRLNVVNLWLPPLRSRGDDVLIIAKALLSKYAEEFGSKVKGFSPQAFAAIRKYSWPGNVRQLENRIKKALVLCDRPLLGPEDLDILEGSVPAILPLEKAKEEFQRRYVHEALERNNGNRTQTARDLGVDPRTIFRYLERESSPNVGGPFTRESRHPDREPSSPISAPPGKRDSIPDGE